MENSGIKYFATMIVGSIILYVAHLLGVWPMLGGHPYWSASATYIGIATGGLMASVSYAILWYFPRQARIHFGVFVIVAVGAIALSTYGKSGFVTSYAEDREAGRIWYYAFIAFIAALLCVAATAKRALRRG